MSSPVERWRRLACLVPLILAVSADESRGRPTGSLSLEARVAAQEAIERIYYAHQIGATRPFEEAVPRAAIERKVQTYLLQSAALEEYWKTPVTPAMLRAELDRIRRDSRFPDRLLAVYHALGDDAFLVEECLARPVLVERLARGFFAFDQRIHGAARTQAEALRNALVHENLTPTATLMHLPTVLEIVRAEEPGRRGPESPGEAGGARSREVRRLEVTPEEFAQWRARRGIGPEGVGAVLEGRDSFTVMRTLAEGEGTMTVAVHSIPKTSWDDWWRDVGEPLAEAATAAVIRARETSPAFAPSNSEQGIDSIAYTCVPDDTWDDSTMAAVPDPRSGHTSTWTGSMMIIWGGQAGVAMASGSRYDPLTDTWSRTSSVGAPGPRELHSAVWTGTEVIVWGGAASSGSLNTGGRYNPLTDTWSPTTLTAAPSPRYNHTAVWTGKYMVVWGGRSDFVMGPGSRYEPAHDKWTAVTATGAPTDRSLHTVLWTGEEMLVWGGLGYSTGDLDTGGLYDPRRDSWRATSTLGAPAGRYQHSAVWTGGEMVVWGGEADYSATQTGGRYDPTTDTWSGTSIVGAPLARSKHSAVWTGTRMVIWGGGSSGGQYDPVVDSWVETATENAPAARVSHTAIWTGSLMIVWGGRLDGTYLATGGRYDPAADSWTPTSTGNLPTQRAYHTAVWTGSVMVVWGGQSPAGISGLLNSGGRYDPLVDAWSGTSMLNAPATRWRHTAVWTGHAMLVWGGQGSSFTPLSTGGRYDPLSDTWQPISNLSAPTACYGHTALWTGSVMVVWGGYDGNNHLRTGGRYDPLADSWTPVSASGAPFGRAGHTVVWTGQRMVVWGGNGPTSYFSDGGQYDVATGSWTLVSSFPLAGRSGHTAVWTGNVMVVWGGSDGFALGSGGRYDPVGGGFWPTSGVNAPTPREAHTAAWSGEQMVIWGGSPSTSTGARYDPVLDAWQPTSLLDAPAARSGHTASWTGGFMVVWGGLAGGHVQSGGRYALGQMSDLDLDGFSWCTSDCNDADDEIHPGAAEICDGVDNDCDGIIPVSEFDADWDGVRVCSADCDDAQVTVYPGAPQLCDGLNNDCNEPSWPIMPPNETDADGDGVRVCANDCNDSDATVWAIPGETIDLQLYNAAATVVWSPSASPGGLTPLYDLLRSSSAADFSGAGTCAETDDTNTQAVDPTALGSRTALFYLVRAGNSCGEGTLGVKSTGQARTGRVCP